MLTRSDFESAIKVALPHYTRTDLLAGNALLHARVLSRGGPGGNTPHALRAFLGETADSLFANERDRKLYRVLDLTSFNPAPKQEAAAYRLGLPFSTYRRHLTAGVDRLTEWLWQQEQEAPQSETTADHSAGRAFSGAAVDQDDNVAEPRDVFQPSASDVAQLSELSAAPPLPDKPSVAVLPFTNMSGDPEQEFFADGIAEDVITALSRYPSLFVIARNSCFTYKGRAVDVKQVGRELGVRYVLEGSLRKAGNRIRVTAQLLEAETGKHVWAERYDRDLADIFEVQDEIAEAAAIAFAPAIADADQHRAMRKPPGSLDAWGAYQRGLWHVGKASADDNARAQMFFRRAIDLDPNFSGAYVGLAEAQNQATDFHISDLAETLSAAEALARRAVALDGADAEARSLLCVALWRRGDYQGALAQAERALATAPNLAFGHHMLAVTLIFSGRPKEGLVALERSIRLDPRDPRSAVRSLQVAIGLYFCHDYEAAIEAAKLTIRAYPEFPNSYRWLAAALGQTGWIEEAKEALEKAIAIAPAAFDMYVRRRVPWTRAEDHAHMLKGLRKGGWREE